MSNYARIQNGIAMEVFRPLGGSTLAESFHPTLASQFEVVPDDVTPGSVRGDDGEWTIAAVVELPPPAPVPLSRHVTVLAFRNRFKAAEKVAIEIASLDNPTAPMPERQQAAALRAFVKDSETATFIDLDYEATREGVQYLEIAGVLQEGRAAEILDAEIQPFEHMSAQIK